MSASQISDDRPSLIINGIYAKGEKLEESEFPRDQVMVRKRLQGLQMFDREHGLVSETSLLFYHNDLKAHVPEKFIDDEKTVPYNNRLKRNDRIYEERTVLIQSLENYQMLGEHPNFSKLMPEDPLTDVRFGENMIVSGLSHKNICIGDIFETEGKESPIRLEVTSPRCPCSNIDTRNGSTYGMNGIRRYTLSEGLAGWFVRVLEPGKLQDGMKLVRVKNPHPKWTLEYLSHALYAKGDRTNMLMCRAQWARSKEELEELCAIPSLGWYEWKSQAQRILDGWGREDVAEKQNGTKTDTASKTAVNLSPLESLLFPHLALQPRILKTLSHWMAFIIVGLAWLGFRAIGEYP